MGSFCLGSLSLVSFSQRLSHSFFFFVAFSPNYFHSFFFLLKINCCVFFTLFFALLFDHFFRTLFNDSFTLHSIDSLALGLMFLSRFIFINSFSLLMIISF